MMAAWSTLSGVDGRSTPHRDSNCCWLVNMPSLRPKSEVERKGGLRRDFRKL
jgi:hypothetical protein